MKSISTLFKKPTFCYAKLNMKLQPMDRHELLEEPLEEILQENKLGEITGGGTMSHPTGEIDYIGIDIDLFDSKKAIPFICNFLEELGAAKGSYLEIGDKTYPFGWNEGIGIYFDGMNLPEEVYKECDINVVWNELNKRLEGIGKILSFWEGAEKTAFYLYGKSAIKMKEAISDFMNSYPLCEGAEISDITPTEETL